MANSFVHLELSTSDVGAAKKFYGDMFGWTFTDIDMGAGMTYTLFKPDNGPGGGMMTNPGAPIAWTAYIEVDDINAGTEKAVGLGAKAIVGPHEVPNMGWFTILIDPTGATIAIWQAK